MIAIRLMLATDAAAVLGIFQAGIDTGDATFETTAPTWEAFDAARLPGHRHVAVDTDGKVFGWVAAAATSAPRSTPASSSTASTCTPTHKVEG